MPTMARQCDRFESFWNYCTVVLSELEINLEYP